VLPAGYALHVLDFERASEVVRTASHRGISRCNGCEKCVRACPVEAMVAVSANDPKRPKRTVARVDAQHCLGCGVCVRTCAPGALALVERSARF
jgi:formate hydrogenlyase subunit 6/NADH:ubiquinone oxidoreductase subunit I